VDSDSPSSASTKAWNGELPADGRDETPEERADRNWTEIVQELRVTQTGTQILAGFLLTVAFQQTFAGLESYQKTVYMVLVVLAAATTTVGLMPVSLHRALFRKHDKPRLVTISDRLLKVVLLLVATLTAGVVFFLFDIVLSLLAGVIAGVLVAAGMTVAILVLPAGVARGNARRG
jgi:hypothetical protein